MGEWAAWASEGIANGGALATLSYVLLITSMLMGRILYLRLFAIASGVTGVLYFWLFLGDRVASVWEMLFIAAVLFQLALTAYRDRTTRFDDDETFFRNAAVPGLSPSEARLLLKQGDRRSLPAGTAITTQGRPSTH